MSEWKTYNEGKERGNNETMNEIIQSLKRRKSVRVYEERPISKEDKELILRSAMEAPTAGHLPNHHLHYYGDDV